MSNTRLDVSLVGLDGLGRIVLSDDLLAALEESQGPISAGESNHHCPGPGEINHSCSNTYCDNSSNGMCTNTAVCGEALNLAICKQPRDVPPD